MTLGFERKKTRRDDSPSRFFLTLLILFCLLLRADVSAAADLTLEMQSHITVSRNPFLLSEVAILNGAPDIVKRIGAVAISIPSDGVLTRDALLEAIVSQGIGGLRLKLIMASKVTIKRDDSLSTLVRNISGWQWQVDVEPLGTVPRGALISPLSIPPGTGSATLKFDDGLGNERALAVRLTWSQPAVVTVCPVERGKILTVADVEMRTVRVFRSLSLASSVKEVVGRTIRKNLSTGEPVPLNLLEESPIIQRGDPVVIVIRKPGFLVEVKGEALDGGAKGENIRVRNLQSRNVIQAMILSSGHVEVE